MSTSTPVRRRLDDSMTLLREVMERPLDPGYAAAAAAPRRAGPLAVVVTLLLAIGAGFGLAVSVQSIRQPERESAAVRQDLRDRIQRSGVELAAAEATNARLQADITAVQQEALGASGAELRERARVLGAAAGAVAVTGSGVRITVDDAPATAQDAVGTDPRTDLGQSAGVVLDVDLQVVVNGLWAAGAEAVAVNGRRLSALSAIRSAGQAILVDFRPLVPPYRIDAIGDPGELQTGFADGAAGPYVQSLRSNNDIQVSIEGAERLSLPAAGQLTLRHVGTRPTDGRTPTP